MKILQKFILLTIIFFTASQAKAVNIDINIFHNENLKKIEFKVISGKYSLEGDNIKIADISKDESYRFRILGDSIVVEKNAKALGTYKFLKIIGVSFINAFSFNPLKGNIKIRNYDDNFILRVKGNSLLAINSLDLEHYIAGVVQSESGGSNDDIEYFFVQAIISRTYALANYLKHKEDGYNLCDNTHCQYYMGRCRNSDIARAVARTGGDVIVDKNNQMISAAYHSNCGGETVNSEDIWGIPTTYLKSVRDTFCNDFGNYNWKFKINTDEFLKYLSFKYHYPITDDIMLNKATHFTQVNRKANFEFSIPLKNIRADLKLKSTFFSIEPQGDMLIFHGKGYGHGVGLCQQGAINMVRLGYSYQDVIKHYYRDVKIINYTELKYKFAP